MPKRKHMDAKWREDVRRNSLSNPRNTTDFDEQKLRHWAESDCQCLLVVANEKGYIIHKHHQYRLSSQPSRNGAFVCIARSCQASLLMSRTTVISQNTPHSPQNHSPEKDFVAELIDTLNRKLPVTFRSIPVKMASYDKTSHSPLASFTAKKTDSSRYLKFSRPLPTPSPLTWAPLGSKPKHDPALTPSIAQRLVTSSNKSLALPSPTTVHPPSPILASSSHTDSPKRLNSPDVVATPVAFPHSLIHDLEVESAENFVKTMQPVAAEKTIVDSRTTNLNEDDHQSIGHTLNVSTSNALPTQHTTISSTPAIHATQFNSFLGSCATTNANETAALASCPPCDQANLVPFSVDPMFMCPPFLFNSGSCPTPTANAITSFGDYLIWTDSMSTLTLITSVTSLSWLTSTSTIYVDGTFPSNSDQSRLLILYACTDVRMVPSVFVVLANSDLSTWTQMWLLLKARLTERNSCLHPQQFVLDAEANLLTGLLTLFPGCRLRGSGCLFLSTLRNHMQSTRLNEEVITSVMFSDYFEKLILLRTLPEHELVARYEKMQQEFAPLYAESPRFCAFAEYSKNLLLHASRFWCQGHPTNSCHPQPLVSYLRLLVSSRLSHALSTNQTISYAQMKRLAQQLLVEVTQSSQKY